MFVGWRFSRIRSHFYFASAFIVKCGNIMENEER